ncbi:hypothetical protein G4G27_22285 [Sphingomonas sp. So64.6b]|uniref:beta family protein n=1 Tax=Sphingomonas sp. So64.6b TaxID=2997354 RepID=UPI00160083DD|nr:beta family protein [Sphingomonas sp. So64.6b]QNA86404.1 hypothetical protein G4G27_22285 [Sphingomonas sp. So64.6b]
MSVRDALYMPQLKWKSGECKALGTARGAMSGRLLPAFRIPPSGGFDPDEQRVLSPLEHIRSFGARLSANWGKRPVFVDASLVDDDKHAAACRRHPLTELIERAWLEGAFAAPIVSLQSSPSYVEAVKRYTSANRDWPICLRLSLSDMERLRSFGELDAVVNTFGASPHNTVLLFDGGALHISDPEPFVHLVAERFAVLAPRNTWARVFWGSTSFPEKPNLKAGVDGRFPRSDWELYRSIVSNGSEFPSVPMFSDYALEFPSYYKPVKVPPVAHLRYSTETDYWIFKGQSTKKPNGFGAIFPVARRLVSSEYFFGEEYSLGNKFIDSLLLEGAKTGNASTWRWASTDHHISLILKQLSVLHEVEGETAREPAIPLKQLQLI